MGQSIPFSEVTRSMEGTIFHVSSMTRCGPDSNPTASRHVNQLLIPLHGFSDFKGTKHKREKVIFSFSIIIVRPNLINIL